MSSTPLQISPKDLFKSCLRREETLEKVDIDEFRRQLAKALIFGPIFVAPGTTIDPIEEGMWEGIKESTRRAIEESIWRGSKYQHLLELSKKAHDRETRWIVLARWLRQENVCEPEEFLPKKLLDNLIYEIWKGTRLDDPMDVTLVEIWLPYFQRLIAEAEVLRQQNVRRIAEELVKAGYDPNAAELAQNERSPFETLYAWLAIRGEKDSAFPLPIGKRRVSPATFRNALYRARRSTERLLPERAAAIFEREIKEIGQRPEFLTPPKAHPSQRNRPSRRKRKPQQ
jgi:hypothetical protein